MECMLDPPLTPTSESSEVPDPIRLSRCPLKLPISDMIIVEYCIFLNYCCLFEDLLYILSP